ncbi:MAG: transglycosylase SLT domain-containing protein, partial [Gammaproteobacteria bacterium]
MGLMASDFDVLRASVRAASDGFGLAYNESQRLAEQFVRSSGVISGASSVAEGVRLSAGFGRGYGINPALSTQFFGTAGRFGGQDNRRLALMIGEAVGKSQLSSKMPEVLSSLSSYLSTAATASLSSPNAAGFLSMLASMSTSGITGLAGNPGGSASIISQVDASIRQGGSAGEASKNFLLGLYSNIAPGFNAFDMGLLNAQGAFGTFKGAFGKDSAAYKMAASRGDKDLMRQYESMSRTPGTVLDLQMQGLVAEYGGSTRGLMKAVSGMYGLTDPQASALIEASRRKGGFGGLKNILELSGIDTRSMSMKDVGRLADLAYGDSAKIESQRRKLLSMDLSSGDERMLASVVGEEEKRRLTLRLTDKYDSKDPGDRAREAQIEMANEMQKLVTGLLPAVLTIKEGIVDIVRFFSDKFGYKSKLIEDLDREKKNKSKVENKKTTPSYPAGFLDDLSFNGNMRMDTVPGSPAKGKVGMQKRREILNRVAARHNFSPKLLEYALTHERSGPYDKSPAGAVGEFQIMPDNFKEYGLDPHDFGQSAEMAARVIDDAIRRYGDNPAAIMAHYNGGWKQGDRVAAGMLPSNEETRRYIDPILRKKALNNTIN